MAYPCMHPGGTALTARMLQMHPLPPAARVLDVGAGYGVTVAFLRDQFHLATIGLEKEPSAAAASPFTICGDAAAIPLENASLDAVLFECSLSKIEHPDAALREAFRLLRAGGALYVSDLYAQNQPLAPSGLLGRLELASTITRQLLDAGFTKLYWQDCPGELTSYWAKLIFENGAELQEQLPSPSSLKKAGCSYFASIWLKPNPPKSTVAMPSPLDAWVGRLSGQPSQCTPAFLQRWQLRQAGQVLEYAKQHSLYYASHLASYCAEDIATPEGLAALPFTDSAVLAEKGSQMLCVSLSEISRIHTLPTSGSTGAPKRIWFSKGDLERTVDFFRTGMEPVAAGCKKVAILMSDSKPGSLATLLQQAVNCLGKEADIMGSLHSGNRISPGQLAGAGCLVGLPADLLYLCRTAPWLKPTSVLLSADYIPNTIIHTLQNVWNCRVYAHYGMTETGYGLAVQCSAQQGQHLRAADFYVEIVNTATGEILPPGCYGEIVLTCLQKRAMPLIRYKTGDWGSLMAAPCPCGSHLPRLGHVKGRVATIFSSNNIHWLDDIIFADPAVLAYRAEIDNGDLHLIVEGGPLAETTCTAAAAAIGCPVTVEYQPICYSFPPGKRCIHSLQNRK